MNTWTHMNLPGFGSHCFVCSFQALFGSFGWLLAFGARPVKTTRIIQNQPKSMTTETKKKLRTHKDTIKYISWILHHCFARPSVTFLEFLAPDWPLQNPKQGLKASEGLYKISACSNLGCPPRFLTHVLDFVEASLLFNPCLGFCRGPIPHQRIAKALQCYSKRFKKQTKFPWCVHFSVEEILK